MISGELLFNKPGSRGFNGSENSTLDSDPRLFAIELHTEYNRPSSYSEKNQNRTIICFILLNFRMCTMRREDRGS